MATIPATPGWYLVYDAKSGDPDWSPILAWETGAVDGDGNTALLPYVLNGGGYAPRLMRMDEFGDHKAPENQIVYRPLRTGAPEIEGLPEGAPEQ